VKVNINGKLAYVSYVSRTQVNALARMTGGGVGQPAGGEQQRYEQQRPDREDEGLARTAHNSGVPGRRKQYVAALHADNVTFVGPLNLIAGVPFRLAKPNDIIVIYAVGCGPRTRPPLPGRQERGAPLASPYEVRIGQVVAPAQAFLAAALLGLCQFNVTVPSLAPGDHALTQPLTACRPASLCSPRLASNGYNRDCCTIVR
jgi:hypothetical protein